MQSAEWTDLRNTSRDFVKVQASIDKILDSIRGKVIDRSVEASHLVDQYQLMLKPASMRLLSADDELGSLGQEAVHHQISQLESEFKEMNANSSKFFGLIKKMCKDHYSWIRNKKFTLKVTIQEPKSCQYLAGSKWHSPTATSAAKIDFSKAMTDTKDTREGTNQKEKMKNEFFLTTLSGGTSSFGDSTQKSSRRQQGELQTLQESLQMLKEERMKNSFASSENSRVSSRFSDVDVVHIEVAPEDVNVVRPLGMLERLKMVVYGTPEPSQETRQQAESERTSVISETLTVQLDKMSSASYSSPQKKPVSVLDQLDAFWLEHDAQSVRSDVCGVMTIQAKEVMLNSSSKKRSSPFCVGI